MEDEIIEILPDLQESYQRQSFTAEQSFLTTRKTQADAHLGPNSPESLVGTVLDDKIVLEKVVGRGGMSVVYKGRHLKLNCPVAVKIIAPAHNISDKAILRLQQEAKTVFSLSHNQLAAVHDLAKTPGGQHYLVMEWVEGESLDALIRQGPLPASVTMDIFRQAAAGLYFAHRKKIVHRDIKPGNIMVRKRADGFYDVKIVDFGIAKNFSDSADNGQSLTQTGEIFGTPLYMSPEQCRGTSADQRSDIYSLGCVMYETLTGAPPFHGENYMATVMAHLTQQPPPPAKSLNIPPLLWTIVKKCLEKKPEDRYQSMSKLSADLLSLENRGGLAGMGAPASSRKTLFKVIAGGTALLALFSALIIAAIVHYYPDVSTISACNQLLKQDPQNPRALFARGQLFIRRKEYTAAAEDLSSAIKANPHNAAAYEGRAIAYLGAHQYHQAIADLNQALVINPHLDGCYKMRAITNFHLGNWDESIADATTYLQLHPRHLPSLLLRARTYNNKHDFKQAAIETANIDALYPGDPDASLIAAQTCNFEKQYEQAEAKATEAIRLGKQAAAYEARAYARYKLGKLGEATEDANKALSLKVGSKDAKIILAQIFAAQGRLPEALALCNEMIDKHRTWYYAYKTRSGIYHLMGNDKAALADTQQAAVLGYKSLPLAQ